MAQAAAGASSSRQAARPAVRARRQPISLEARLQSELAIDKRATRAVSSFQRHRAILNARAHRVVTRATLVRARLRLARARAEVAKLQRAIHLRHVRRLRPAEPRDAICGVFRNNCRDAVDVAWCESRLDTAARNGQYLGLFQMGTFARERFGHGSTAWEQATAAHKYFVSSGRNWSPWSCKPTHAYS